MPVACHGAVLDGVGVIAAPIHTDGTVVLPQRGAGNLAVVGAQPMRPHDLRWLSVHLAEATEPQLRCRDRNDPWSGRYALFLL